MALGVHQVLVGDVEVIAHDAVVAQVAVQEEWYSSRVMPLSIRNSYISESTRWP